MKKSAKRRKRTTRTPKIKRIVMPAKTILKIVPPPDTRPLIVPDPVTGEIAIAPMPKKSWWSGFLRQKPLLA